MSTTSPDVQNVPDVWGLLEEAKQFIDEWVDSSNGGPISMVLSNAIAQRDRFVLVPKEPTDAMIQAVVAPGLQFSGAWHTFLKKSWPAMLAAAPKPSEKP